MTMSSRPPSLRSPVGTNREVNEPLRSLGRSNPTSPTSVSIRFGTVPLRKHSRTPPGRVVFLIAQVLGQPRPASRVPCTALTSSGNNPPSPVKAIPRSLAEANNSPQQPIINQLPPQLTRPAERLTAPRRLGHSQSPSDQPNPFYANHPTPSKTVSFQNHPMSCS